MIEKLLIDYAIWLKEKCRTTLYDCYEYEGHLYYIDSGEDMEKLLSIFMEDYNRRSINYSYNTNEEEKMRTNKSYRIRKTKNTMIIENEHGEHIAEYKFTSPTSTLSDIRSMYRTIDDHIAKGGTLGNYQW